MRVLDIRIPPLYDLIRVPSHLDRQEKFPDLHEEIPNHSTMMGSTGQVPRIYDALIIGGGPAGLSAALGLCRMHRTTAVFSHGQFRNEGAIAMHNVASRDGQKPAEFRGTTREQILKYGLTDFLNTKIVKMYKESFDAFEGFEIKSQDGRIWRGRKLVMAMGSKDIFPSIPGYVENWPHNIYQCLFCDGHEKRHLPKGVLTFAHPLYLHFALQQVSLSPTGTKVYVFCDGAFPKTDEMQKARMTLEASGCIIEERRIQRLVPAKEGLDVVLEDDTRIFVGFLAHKPDPKLVGEDMMKELGLEVENTPLGAVLKTQQPYQSTNVKGVFAAGDCITPMKSVANALNSGVMAAGAVANELVAEDGERALARWKPKAGQKFHMENPTRYVVRRATG